MRPWIKTGMWGTAALVCGVALWTYIIGPMPWTVYRLMKHGEIAQATITYAEEEPGDRGEGWQSTFGYTFTTSDGRESEGHINQRGRLCVKEGTTFPVAYIPSDPATNYPKLMLPESLWEFAWRRVGMGLILLAVLSSVGVSMLAHANKRRRLLHSV